jgi:uncharacterized protein
MPQTTRQAAIAEALADLRLIDTHEHTAAEAVRLGIELDFTYLLADYLSSDLISAGMPADDLEAVRTPGRKMDQAVESRILPRDPVYPFPERLPLEELSIEEKWRHLAPFWEKTRNTSYARYILIAIRDLFGIDDLNEGTYQALSEALQASNKKGWYQHVLRERAGIEVSVVQYGITKCGTMDMDRDLFVPSIVFDQFVDIRDPIDLRRLEYDTDVAIQSVDDLIRALGLAMGRKVEEGMVAVKTGLAYQRAIYYGEATRHEAEQVFNRLFRHPQERLSWEEAKPLQDYMMHQVIRCAIDHRRPIQVHTGLQEGNANVITNSSPTLLLNLFLQYPKARFDIFHASYPYHSELAVLAKNFPNVYADLCWMYLISPWMAASILHEWLETVPANKILGFGGDSIIVEGTYAHSRIARQVIARVLAEKVEGGYCTEREAVTFGQMILRGNAKDLFGL